MFSKEIIVTAIRVAGKARHICNSAVIKITDAAVGIWFYTLAYVS